MARKKYARRRRRGGLRGTPLLLLLAVIVGAAWYYGPFRARPPHRAHHATATTVKVAATASATATAPRHAEIPAIPTAARSVAPQPSQMPASTAPQSAAGYRLAIVIDDCGQWLKTERAMIALPIPVTLSVMPDERYTQTIAQEASAAGKGVMLHLPMEPVGTQDPGRGKVTTAMTSAQIVAQVKTDIAAVPLAKGVNNHEGSKASADPRVMRDVISVIAGAGLFFIDSRTSAQSVGASAAQTAGVPVASRDVFLDNTDSVDAVEAMLRHAADVAKTNGSAIAIGHPRQATLDAIRALIPELQARGIDFTLASELVKVGPTPRPGNGQATSLPIK